MRFVSAYDIATDICVNLGDPMLSKIDAVLRNVINATNELHNHALPSVKSGIFQVPNNLVLALPSDSGVVTKVGVIDSKGRLNMLYPDNNLRVAVKNELTKCDETDEAVSTADLCFYHFDDYGQTHWYGRNVDIAIRGTYRHDTMSQTIEFGSVGSLAPGDDVIVEYQSHGHDRYTLIPEEAKTLIYQRALFLLKSASNPSEAELHFRQFRVEFGQYKSLVLKRDPNVYMRALILGHNSAPK